jgi:hypothetical protein
VTDRFFPQVENRVAAIFVTIPNESVSQKIKIGSCLQISLKHKLLVVVENISHCVSSFN